MRTGAWTLWVLTALSAPILTAEAQVEKAPTNPANDLAETCSSVGLDPELYGMLLNRNFVALLGSAQTVPGSFGSLEIDKDQKAKFAASAHPGRGRVWGLEVSAGVEDGILTLINDKEAGSSFSADFKLHFMLRPGAPVSRLRSLIGRTMLEYDNASCYAYVAAAATATDSLNVRLDDVRQRAPTVRQRIENAKLRERLGALVDSMSKVRALRTRRDTIKLDSLRLDSARAEALRAIEQSRFIPDAEDQELEARAKYSTDLRAAHELLKVTGFSVAWFSITGGGELTKFKLFDPVAAFDSQLTDDSYLSPRVVVSYNRFTLSKLPNRSRFWTLGLRGALEDNLGTLKKVELTEKKQYGPNPDDRVGTKTVSARQGDYEDDLGSLAAFADLYWFLFRDNQSAIHVFPQVVWKDTTTTYQAGLGVLWSAKNEKSASINAELFWNLTDLTEAQPSDDNVWERSQLGLRLTFPLNFTSR